jgi:hypothetical protein
MARSSGRGAGASGAGAGAGGSGAGGGGGGATAAAAAAGGSRAVSALVPVGSRLKRRSMASHTRHSASGSVVLGSMGSVWLSVRGEVGSCRPVQHSYLDARRHATLIVCVWL